MAQQFDTVDYLRLEVETDPTGLVNMVQNPSGELGGWGWVTPVPGSTLTSAGTTLKYTSPGSVASYFYTEPMAVAAGQYVAASWTDLANIYRAKIEWLNSSLVVIGSATQTGYIVSGGNTVNYGPYLAPAATAYCRLRFDHFSNTSGGNPTAGSYMYVTNVTVAKAATSGALGTLRANLVPNPSFETDTKGWSDFGAGLISRSTAQASSGSASLLSTGNDEGDGYVWGEFVSTQFPVEPNTGYAAQMKIKTPVTYSHLYLEANVIFYTSARVRISGGSFWGSPAEGADLSNWTTVPMSGTSPANAAYAEIYVYYQLNDASSNTVYFDAFSVEKSLTVGSYFDGSTTDAGGVIYDWTNQTPVVTTRTNYVINPSFETNATGWTAGTNATVARSTAQAHTGTASLLLTKTVSSGTASARALTGTSGRPVVAGKTYRQSAYFRAGTAGRTVRASLDVYNAAGSYLGSSVPSGTDASSGWTRVAGAGVTTASILSTWPTAAFVGVGAEVLSAAVGEVHYLDAVMLEEYSGSAPDSTYFDGATADGTGDFSVIDRAWTATAHASASTETTTLTLPYSTATTSNLAFIEPVPYLNILGETKEIRVKREALNVGTLSAEVLSMALDPSQADLIRPGRRCRLLAYAEDLTAWLPLFTGKLTEASVSYELKDPRIPTEKRARIQLSAVDNTAVLANQKRTEGVTTIDDLPYILEGCGVPWNANGSGNQVASATVVALNENASALDQVSITRDTNLGYAWVDRYGTLQAWDPDELTAFGAPMLDNELVTELDKSYNSQDCINEVTIKFLRHNPSTGETEEVPYGPYRNETSISEWGVRSATFTIQGLSEETSDIPDLAAVILAANADPVVRVNSVTCAARETWMLSPDYLLGDVMDYALLQDEGSEDSFISTVEHTITPDKWLVKYGFLHPDVVASPQFTPSPLTGAGGLTIGQLLRPVGEITMYFSATPPAGWLACNGGTFSSNDYPDLAAALGDTFGVHSGTTYYLPNLTDKFPIGSGTKAIGTTGGAPTKTLVAANLPPHNHVMTHGHIGLKVGAVAVEWLSSVFANGTARNGIQPAAGANVLVNDFVGNTGNGPGTSSAVDVMNPWLSVAYMIRAR